MQKFSFSPLSSISFYCYPLIFLADSNKKRYNKNIIKAQQTYYKGTTNISQRHNKNPDNRSRRYALWRRTALAVGKVVILYGYGAEAPQCASAHSLLTVDDDYASCRRGNALPCHVVDRGVGIVRGGVRGRDFLYSGRCLHDVYIVSAAAHVLLCIELQAQLVAGLERDAVGMAELHCVLVLRGSPLVLAGLVDIDGEDSLSR